MGDYAIVPAARPPCEHCGAPASLEVVAVIRGDTRLTLDPPEALCLSCGKKNRAAAKAIGGQLVMRLRLLNRPPTAEVDGVMPAIEVGHGLPRGGVFTPAVEADCADTPAVSGPRTQPYAR